MSDANAPNIWAFRRKHEGASSCNLDALMQGCLPPSGESPRHSTLMERTKETIASGRRAAWARLLAFLVTAIIIASHASSFAHLLLVEHAVCPQHGEWIHADELGAHAESAPAESPQAGQSTLKAALSPEAEHAHDHCAAPSERRKYITAEPRSPAVSSPCAPSPLAMRAAEDAPRARSVALFYLAPKNSPPV